MTYTETFQEAQKKLNEINAQIAELEALKAAFPTRQAEINELAAKLAALRAALSADKSANRDALKTAKTARKDAERAMKAAKREMEREAKRAQKKAKKTEKTKAGQGEKTNRKWNEGTLATDVLADLCANYGLRSNTTKPEYDAIRKAYLKKNHPDLHKENKDLQDAMCRWAMNHINAFWAKSRFYIRPENWKTAA